MEVSYEEENRVGMSDCNAGRRIVDDIHAGARAAEGKVIDGSELTHDEESIGYDTKITRGEDLLTGYSKCTKLGDGKIYAGGTTVARQVVKSVQIAVLVERAKEEDKEWSYYDNWHKENKNTNRAMSNRTLYVEGGYYYRVRCTHAANSDVSSSFTGGIYID